MAATEFIPVLIALLAVVLFFVIWPSLLRILLQFLRNVVLGLGLLWIIGEIFGETWQIGINPLNAGVCGILGVPGWILLLILRGVLR